MAQNETIKTIMLRRSVRSYTWLPVPGDVLKAVLDAGQAAPYVSPGSRHFTVIRDRPLVAEIGKAAAAEGAKISEWHRRTFSAAGFDGTYGAPVLVLLSGKESTVQYEAVVAAAVQNILIAAGSLGLSSCWAYFPVFIFHGENANEWKTRLKIPEGFKPCAGVLLGYSDGDPLKQNGTENGSPPTGGNAVTFIGE